MSKKAKILTISKPYVASAYRDKLHRFMDSNYEVGLICPPSWGSQNYENSKRDNKIWLSKVPIYFNGKNHFHWYKNIEKAILDFNPDIINLEEEHYSIVTLQVARIAKKHGIKFTFYTWQNIYKKYPLPFRLIEKYIFNYAGAAIVGNFEAGKILKQKGFKQKIFQIPQMGVNIDIFKPQSFSLEERNIQKTKLNLNTTDFIIGFVGRIVEEKGIQDIIKAMALLGDKRLRLLLIGGGLYKTELENLASSLGVAAQVQFVGQVNSQSVPNYLQAIDLMCLPSHTKSNWKEQFGRIIIESMAAGALVLGSDSGEIPLVIDKYGYVFKEQNHKDLAKKLKIIYTNRAQAQNEAEVAFKYVEAKFSNKIVAQKFSNVFEYLSN